METKVFSAETVDQAAVVIRAGGLVAFPTETVYGLGANALDPYAVASIFRAKKRPADNPLIVHITDTSWIERIAYPVPIVEKLAAAFWPGPLTIILKKKEVIPDIVTGGLDTVAIRIPDHPVAYALIRLSGVPIVAPSANLSGKPSATAVDHVLEDFDGIIDAVIESEPSTVGLESTVLDLTNDPPQVLRPGSITLDDIQTLVPEAIYGGTDPEEPVRSPGMKYTHYSPKAEVWLVLNEKTDQINNIVRDLEDAGHSVAIINTESNITFSMTLYDQFRKFDAQGVTDIICTAVPEKGLGTALMNRLRKAATYIIQ